MLGYPDSNDSFDRIHDPANYHWERHGTYGTTATNSITINYGNHSVVVHFQQPAKIEHIYWDFPQLRTWQLYLGRWTNLPGYLLSTVGPVTGDNVEFPLSRPLILWPGTYTFVVVPDSAAGYRYVNANAPHINDMFWHTFLFQGTTSFVTRQAAFRFVGWVGVQKWRTRC